MPAYRLRPLIPCRLGKLCKDTFKLPQRRVGKLLNEATVTVAGFQERDNQRLVFPDDEVLVTGWEGPPPREAVVFAGFKPKGMEVTIGSREKQASGSGNKFSRWLGEMLGEDMGGAFADSGAAGEIGGG